MGDVGDIFNDMKRYQKALRRMWGVKCTGCQLVQPNREPTNMLPGQVCKVCQHKDPRPRLTEQQVADALNAEGA